MAHRTRRLPRYFAPLNCCLLGIVLALGWCPEIGAAGTGGGEKVIGKEQTLIEIPHDGHPVAIAGGEIHYRDFELAAGDLLHVVAEQEGIDVAVRLLAPDGGELVRIDSPNGRHGPEELVEIVPGEGRYRIELVAPRGEVEPGRYLLTTLAQRPATAEDRELVAADHAYHAARQLLKDKAAQQAIDGFLPVLESWRRLGLRHREADTLEHLCRARQHSGEMGAAVELCEQAAAWYRILDEPRKLAFTLQNAGAIHLRLGDHQRAIECLREAVPLFEAHGNARGLTTALSRLGTAHHRQGRIRSALGYFDRALERCRTLGRPGLEATIRTDLGAVLLVLHRSRDALDQFARAKEIYQRLGHAKGLAIVANDVAEAAMQLGDPELAESSVKEALKALYPLADPHRQAIALNTLGSILSLKRDFAGARRAFENALELSRQVGDARTEAIILTGLGHLHVLSGDPQRGLELHDQAFERFTEIDDRKGLASSRVRGAEALRDLDRLDEAWQRLEPALEVIETLRNATARRDFRLSYFAFRQDYYAIAFDLLMRLHQRRPEAGYDARAIAVNDRRLARELLDSLTLPGASARAEVDPALLAAERRLETRLRELANAPPNEARNRQTSELIARLHRIRDDIRQTVVTAAPPVRAPDPDLAFLRESLRDGESLLLVYTLGEERSYLGAITAQERSFHELPARREIESRARDFRRELARLRERSQDERLRLGRELSDVLLGPVAARLGGRRLLIVAEGELVTTPFAALPPPGPGADDAALIENHEIVYLPSISTLTALRRGAGGRPDRRARLALFADPVFRPDDPRVRGAAGGPHPPAAAEVSSSLEDLARSAEELRVDPLLRLDGSRAEAEAIREKLHGSGHLLALDFDASRESFLNADLRGYGVLHFATHGLLHPETELSGLVLSLVDQQGRPRDGFLRTFEISRLDLPVDLVVLSACETGLGEKVRGEGTLGLAWAFLNAGATGVVASLWKVSDPQTAELMSSFYAAYLEEDLPPSAALRRAQLKILAQPGSIPYDWAAFVFQGDWHHHRR